MLRIGIDTGGTFTDFVYSLNGETTTFKLPSTPEQPERAVLEGLRRIISDSQEFLVRYGSTVATNALLERKGAKTVLVANQGFEDIIEIGRQNRPGLYRLGPSRPVPLVPQQLRVGVKERTLHDGSHLVSLEPKSLDWLRTKVSQLKPESVAVSLLYSYLNPESENRIEAALRDLGVPISLSHRVHGEFREFERTSATVVNAYLVPVMTRYLTALALDPVMSNGKLTVMQSNGGAISGEVARSEPVRTLLSGPAGGVVGAFRFAQEAGFDRIITLDMGGTSTDVCLCDQRISVTNESNIDHLPIPISMIGIHAIGAGGGSIARVDAGGLLRVGPQSAGADPGPVAYGKGQDVTVTDAHLFLGHLHPDYFLDGELELFPNRIRPALEKLSSELQAAGAARLELDDIADGILRIINTQMENAIRLISLQKGHDTRQFSLVSYGGSGGLHACQIARSLMIPRVVIPPDPGLVSAAGVLAADVIKDSSRTLLLRASNPRSSEEIRATFNELEAQVMGLLAAEGLSQDDVRIIPTLDARYPGQSHELNVEHSEDYVQSFHDRHDQFYGYCNPELDVEVVTLRVRGIGASSPPPPPRHPIASEFPVPEALVGQRPIRIDGRTSQAKIYARSRLKAGNRFKGPAVIVEYSATTLVPENFDVRVDEWHNLILQERNAQDRG